MLRERTLLHLLLSVARSLGEVPENSKYRDLLHDSCETLKITRDRNGPYTISILNQNGQLNKNVETSNFRFHERGDIEAQIQKRRDLPDARTHNWEQATNLWREILGVNLKKSQGLAPARPNRNKVKRLEIISLMLVSMMLLSLDFFFDQNWPVFLVIAWTVPLTRPRAAHLWIATCTIAISWLISGFENPVLVFALIGVSLHLEHMIKSRLVVFLPFGLCVFLMIFQPSQLVIIVIILLFEIIVSLAQLNLLRLLVQVISILVAIAFLFLNDSFDVSISSNGLMFTPFVVLLIILVFPYSSESNLIRISAPITLLIATICLGYEARSTLLFLTAWLFGFIKIADKKIPTDRVVETSGIPVLLRKRDLAS